MFRFYQDLCVNLAQIPVKCLVMDIVVANVPPKYGMLLSRSWGAKLQGTMQMDMTYATIPVFNQTRIFYRESHTQYMDISQEDQTTLLFILCIQALTHLFFSIMRHLMSKKP